MSVKDDDSRPLHCSIPKVILALRCLGLAKEKDALPKVGMWGGGAMKYAKESH